MQRLHFIPKLRLRRLKKRNNSFRKQRTLLVPLRSVTLFPTRLFVDNLLHVRFKDFLCRLTHLGGRQFSSILSRLNISNGVM